MTTRENIILPKVTRERISADPSTWAPKLTTACPVIDKWLRGGVPTRHVTELTGEAGAAKTQLALQLLLNAQLPREVGGLDGAAVYVHTEGRAPLARLRQMISKRQIYSAHLPPDHDPLDYVYLVKTLEEDPESLWDALASVADVLTDPPGGPRRPVRLIVVDSVSSPFRETDASTKEGVFERTGILSRVAALISEYAHRADVAVVVTNHVSDAVRDDGRGGFDSRQRRLFGPSGDLRSSGRPVQPALGLFWANCVNTRVFLSRTGGSAGGYDNDGRVGLVDSGGTAVVRRHASVVFSSHLPSTAPAWGGALDDGWGSSAVRPCEFEVREDGVWGVEARGEEEEEKEEEEKEEEEEEEEKEEEEEEQRLGKEKRRPRRDGRAE